MDEFYGVIEHVAEKGFGFIKVEGYQSNLFFHATNVDAPFKSLRKGQQVKIGNIESNDKGYVAKQISVI